MESYEIMNNRFLTSLLVSGDKEIIFGKSVDELETETSRLWIINPNSDEIDHTKLEMIDNDKCHSWELPGIWSVLILDKLTSKYRAISSINNELPWYYCEDNFNAVSNSLVHLSKLTGLKEPDYISICSHIGLDWSVGGYSFISGIKKSQGGSILYLSESKVLEKQVDMKRWLGFDDSINDTQVLIDQLVEACKLALNNDKVELTLTGGKDSRSLLAASLLTKLPFKTMTGTAKIAGNRDIRIARLISKRLGLKHVCIDASNEYSPSYREVFSRFAVEFDSEFIARNWIIFYKEYVQIKDYVTRIMGYGGEYYTGFYSNVANKLKSKMTDLRKEYSIQVMDRVKEKMLEFKELSERDARDLFYLRDRDQFWAGGNVRAYINYCKVYTPLKDPGLVALAYRFQGGIRSSNLQSKIIQTLPENVKNIPSGYPYWVRVIFKIKKKLTSYVDYNYMVKTEEFLDDLDYNFIAPVMHKNQLKSLVKAYDKRGVYDTLLHKILAVQYFFKVINER
jgi:hypothetical protein